MVPGAESHRFPSVLAAKDNFKPSEEAYHQMYPQLRALPCSAMLLDDPSVIFQI